MTTTIRAAAAAIVLALAGCGDDSGAAATATTTTVRETTRTTIDPVAAWCATDWAEIERQSSGDPDIDATETRESLDYMLDVAERGTLLDHPDIAAEAAVIVEQLTWPDRLAEDPAVPAPDPAAFTMAMIRIMGACDRAVRP